ncbi:hypothetical protein BU23DRAFT_585987 [Bimuria novae-zelandiae CBS 107.79]|uniref:Rhodopsin domain-containing protein n=1 Tax=Bimuria novae-zelandiae CBS 107.79 TaxID=1447943 RepID=A0A6A5VTZ9_9PLEO|nr:hypothetical protein BU23DRAFT_585987 [Bimuria novae-zelandiae CBS 107.79]
MYLRPGFLVVIVGMTLTSLSTIVVMLRYYCRWYRMGIVGATDHLMFIALIFTWGNTVINYYQDQSSRKVRPSFFRIPEKRPLLESALHGTLVTWYIYRMTYGVALCFVKLSILWFYRAIASHRTFRRSVNILITFVILYTFATTIAAAFQCEKPSESFDVTGYLSQFDHDPNTKKPHFKCYDPTRLWVFTSAVNLFTDVLIMLLPIPTLLGLRVPMSKRLALVGIFSVGIMAIIASCVRMWVMALWSESPENSAVFGTDLLLWGQVETNSGIVSASVPFLRLFFRGSDRRPDEKPLARRKVQEIRSPKKIPTDGVPLQKESMEFFDGRKGNEESGGSGSPEWSGFITVPASLSSASRGSAILEPVQAHLTV